MNGKTLRDRYIQITCLLWIARKWEQNHLNRCQASEKKVVADSWQNIVSIDHALERALYDISLIDNLT